MSCIYTNSNIDTLKSCIEISSNSSMSGHCIERDDYLDVYDDTDITKTTPNILIYSNINTLLKNDLDIPIPEIEYISSGGGTAEYDGNNLFIAYELAQCKLKVTNHREIVDAGLDYSYVVCSAGASLSSDGTITWTEPREPGIFRRTMIFRFYKGARYSQRMLSVHPEEANVIEVTDRNGNVSTKASQDVDFFCHTFDRDTANTVKKVKVINILSNVRSMEAFLSVCQYMTEFECEADTSKITAMEASWNSCISLTSFPKIDTSSVTNLRGAWHDCRSLTSFPKIDTSSVTDMFTTWIGCSSLTSFPEIDTSSVVSMNYTWKNCISLTSFPEIDTSNVQNMICTWLGCNSLTSFPPINTGNVRVMDYAWSSCSALVSFPSINTDNVSSMICTWADCGSLTAFGGVSNCSAADWTTWSTPLNPKPCGQS